MGACLHKLCSVVAQVTGRARRASTDCVLRRACADRHGKVCDASFPGKPSAARGAVANRKANEFPSYLIEQPGDDVVHMFPKFLDPQASERQSPPPPPLSCRKEDSRTVRAFSDSCQSVDAAPLFLFYRLQVEVLMLVAAAPRLPVAANDLNSTPKLELVVSCPGDSSGEKFDSVSVDLKPYVASSSSGAATKYGNGVNAMVVATVFLDKPGWTVHFDAAVHPHDNWGLLVPEMQSMIRDVKAKLGIPLDASSIADIDPSARHTISRFGEDHTLVETANQKAAEATPVESIRVDVGWELYRAEDDEEVEGCAMEYSVLFYNLEGEELFAVNGENPEAEGVVVGRPEVEEEEREDDEQEVREVGGTGQDSGSGGAGAGGGLYVYQRLEENGGLGGPFLAVQAACLADAVPACLLTKRVRA